MMDTFRVRLALAGIGGTLVVTLAQLHAGAGTVTDLRKNCELTTPDDWTVKAFTAYSPDKSISASVNGGVARGSFDEGKKSVQNVMKPLKMIQDDGKRLIYTFDPGPLAPGKTGWYVVINSTPVCAASFMFPPNTNEATIRKIADTLAAAKH